jgi:hypothetical protein
VTYHAEDGAARVTDPEDQTSSTTDDRTCSCEHAQMGRTPGTYAECDPDCERCAEAYADFLSGRGDW